MNKLFLIIVALFPSLISTHPHMFVDASIEVVFNKNGISGFNVKWVFDDMFSAAILEDYDKNNDKNLSKTEVAKIQKKAFSYTAEQSYFTRIKIGKKNFPVKRVKHFNAFIKNNRLVYTFLIPCDIAVDKTQKTVTFAVFDSTFYASFEFNDKKPIKFRNGTKFEYKVKKHDNTTGENYFGQMAPFEFIVNFRRK